MKKTMISFVLGVVLLGLSFPAKAQQSKVSRVGVLVPGGVWYEIIDGLRVGLRELRAQQQAQALKDIEEVRKALNIKIQSLATGNLQDFERAISEISRDSPDALLVARSQVTLNNQHRIFTFATQRRLPTIYAESESVDAGGLMSYGADTRDLYRRAAIHVDKILKGTKPGDLPIERPTKFEFVINLKTAKQIGVTIPANVLARADRVIR